MNSLLRLSVFRITHCPIWGTLAVVKEAIADYQAQVANAWQLNPRLQDMGKQKVSLARDAREHLPRADVSYQFKSAAGTVKIHITSAGETFKLEITAGKNPYGQKIHPSQFPDQHRRFNNCRQPLTQQLSPAQAAAPGEHNPNALPLTVAGYKETECGPAFGIF